ncbi:unnamed protein product [Closterium sp. NIES-65]|nr:unnamed protein product [Closterium sp. NIES-65]
MLGAAIGAVDDPSLVLGGVTGETRSSEPPDGAGGAKLSPPHADSLRDASDGVAAVESTSSAAESDASTAPRGLAGGGGDAVEDRGASDEKAQTAEEGRAVADGNPAEGMVGGGGAERNGGMQSAAVGDRGHAATEGVGGAAADEGEAELVEKNEGEATGRGEAEGSRKEERKDESSGKEQNAGGQGVNGEVEGGEGKTEGSEGVAGRQQGSRRGRLREMVRRAEQQRRVVGYLDVGREVARSVERHHRAQHGAGAPRGEGQAGGGNGGEGQGGHGDREHGGGAGKLPLQHGHAPHHAFTDSAPLHAPPLAPLHAPLHAPHSPLRAGGRLQQLQAEEWGGGGEGGMGRDVSTNSNMGAAEWLEGCLEEEEEWQQWRIDPQQLVIKSFLARGTYGSVHRGEYRGKQVAGALQVYGAWVKLMDWGEVDKASRAKLTFLRDVFAQEVLVWSTLEHKNICQFVGALLGGPDSYTFPSTVEDHRGVLHVGSHFVGALLGGPDSYTFPSTVEDHRGVLRVGSHVCCVVLEFLAGGTLKQLLMKHYHKKLSVHRVVHLALDIAEGLEVVKIADFGVSRVKSDSSTMHHKTGTYGYMAPEVLKERPYDHKADVYSYGILLWEIYCCDNPFPYSDLDPTEIASTVNQGLRPDIPSCCPPQLAELMRRCWHGEAGKRPDMSEVVRRLKAIDCRHATPMRPVEGDDSSCSLM